MGQQRIQFAKVYGHSLRALLVVLTLLTFACGKSRQPSRSVPKQETTAPAPTPAPSPDSNSPEIPVEPVEPSEPEPVEPQEPTPTPDPDPQPETKPDPEPVISSQITDGDLIFQVSQSRQSAAIAEATGSQWTHVGIIFKDKGRWLVYEAASQVTATPIDKFIQRGLGQKYVIKRINPKLGSIDLEAAAALRLAARQYFAKPYDIFFEWSNRAIYCSELVYKVFAEVLDIEIGKVQRWRDLKFDGPNMKALIAGRIRSYGRDLDMDQPIVTPVAQLDSEILVSVPNPKVR